MVYSTFLVIPLLLPVDRIVEGSEVKIVIELVGAL